MFHGRWISSAFAIAAIVGSLVGCSSSVHSTRIDTSKQFDPANGVVAIQVTSNTNQLSEYNKNWDSVNVIRLDTIEHKKQKARKRLTDQGKEVPPDSELKWSPDIYPLEVSKVGVNESRIFFGVVPEGHYTVANISSYYYDGSITSRVSMPVWQSGGEFRIKGSRLTDLGNILFQPLLNIKQKSFWRANNQKRAYVTRTFAKIELGNLLKIVHPALNKHIDFENPLTWSVDNADKFRQRVSKISLANLYGTDILQLRYHAKGILPTRLGKLRIIDDENNWSQLSLPTQAQILSATDNENQIILGAERGLVFSAKTLGDNWKKQQALDPSYAITWLGSQNENYFAIARKGNNHTIFTFKDVNKKWKSIRDFKTHSSVLPVIDNNHLNVYSNGKRFQYSTTSNTWSESKDIRLSKLKRISSSVLIGLEEGLFFKSSDQALSVDNGKNWITIERKLKFGEKIAGSSLPFLTDDKRIFTVGRKGNKDIQETGTGAREQQGTLHLLELDFEDPTNEDKSIFHGLIEPECASLIPGISAASRIYVICDKGAIKHTTDLGKTWVTDVLIDLLSMQNSYDELVKGLSKSN